MTTSSSTPNGSPTLPLLLKAIEGYFDCTLSETEEKILYKWLSTTTYRHQSIDEARAVMGITHLNPLTTTVHLSSTHTTSGQNRSNHNKGHRAGRFLLPLYSAAAAAVAILLLVANLLPFPRAESTCIAYAGGKKIVDENEVLALLQSQIADFHSQSQAQSVEFIDQLSDLPPVVEGNSEISDLFL